MLLKILMKHCTSSCCVFCCQDKVLQNKRQDLKFAAEEKTYRQKGTGRARAGTIRSPLWRGGGMFAATPRDYSKKINKKMYRAAIRSIFSNF